MALQAYQHYDYSCTPPGFSEWLPEIRKLDSIVEKSFIFTNNHWRGQVVSTIRQLRTVLD